MSATSIFDKYCSSTLFQARRWAAILGLLAIVLPMTVKAAGKSDAEEAAHTLAKPSEKEGFEFRADSWVKELKPEMGKALRIQLFKGNEYRFCIAVAPDSGVHIAATVLDFDGKPIGKAEATAQGWGVVLSVKPKKTGAYAVAIRQAEGGTARDATCAVITGWK